MLLDGMTLAVAAATAWSQPITFPGWPDFGPIPRTAIATDGHHYTAWEDAQGALLASADGAAPERLADRSDDYVAAAAPGRAAVAYSRGAGAFIAVRGEPQRRLVKGGVEDIALAADPRGGWVFVAQSKHHVLAFSLDRRGRTVRRQDLGNGAIEDWGRQSRVLTVTPSGRAYLAMYGPPPRPLLVVQRRHGGPWAKPVRVPGQPERQADYTDLSVVAAGERVAIGALTPTSCGDVGCAGFPLIGGPTEPLHGPRLTKPNRVFAPAVAPGVLVYQQKTGKKSFSRSAPVVAVAGGRGQRLTGAPAAEPVPLPLSGGRTLVLWTTAKGWGAALAHADGRFRSISAPPGPPTGRFHTADTDRDVQSAGRYAIAAWGAEGLVHISVRRFP
ncbi:hypothetical protein OJ997_32665 [Solirubrobacter phytolaccae]|uniref:Uncharacterized protein n=1 Tax=Solirubrobacter phytolaccae TaxID=1404360 RepID=A0A9X3SBV7_9ACTN|nr:hypothetical protein [Solirubrobacter phytolaccae]MDA0185103.1 hypothetical protein [Solirubrobacter phytolaccae]